MGGECPPERSRPRLTPSTFPHGARTSVILPRSLPPGCHGGSTSAPLTGTRRNGTGTVTREIDCKTTPHLELVDSLLRIQSLSRLRFTLVLCEAHVIPVLIGHVRPQIAPGLVEYLTERRNAGAFELLADSTMLST